ncbi:hypothetical protein THRCLA_03444 [Thraustotheca clavata]|uniref:Retinoblastoma-associated protein A-box domain-containing protein n=1 Tax=Thraustotheca clavata TaxID=74557 RepID=A0A1W0A2A8_9STRA|nr:hypothetical protein THRCLA_03444 [Thraustotheca clavata]
MRLDELIDGRSLLDRMGPELEAKVQKLLSIIEASVLQQEHLHLAQHALDDGMMEGKGQRNVWAMAAFFAILNGEQVPEKAKTITLCELLKGCKIGLSVFLNSFTNLCNMLILDLGPDLMTRANILKERLTIASVLFTKYEQLWNTSVQMDLAPRKRNMFEAGWLLFLIVRSRLNMCSAGLGELYYMLLAVLQLVITKVNARSVEAEIAAALSSLGSPNGQSAHTIIEQLCAKPMVNRADVDNAIEKLEKEIQVLETTGVLELPPAESYSLGSTMFNDAILPQNIEKLRTHYQITTVKHVYDLDESIFVNAELKKQLVGPPPPQVEPSPAPFAPTAPSASSFEQAWQWQGQPPPNKQPAKSPLIPKRSPSIAQTPVTAAVETSNWVRSTLAALPTSPSEKLLNYFDNCVQAPQCKDLVVTLITEQSNQITSVYRPSQRILLPMGSSQSPTSQVEGSLGRTKLLGIGLYYRVLEALLDAEADRRQTSDHSMLLSNTAFHKALFACSMEVVLKAHSLVTLAFPQILTTCGVSAFDFGKILESFVKRAPQLPSELKRHLRDLEQTVLDSLVWQSNSGLYALLTESSSSEHSVNPGRFSILQIFFRKVLALAANRIYALGQHLKLEAKYLNQIWTCVKECISTYQELLKDRHLDHLILCSFYGVCKVNHVLPEVTFKRVLEAYKRTYPSAAKSSIVREIPLGANVKGDVIKFYNRCFIPTLKGFLLQFQLHDHQQAAADAVTPFVQPTGHHLGVSDNEVIAEAATLAVERILNNQTSKQQPKGDIACLAEIQSLPRPSQRSSPKRVLQSNLFISPLRQIRPPRTALTPRTHALYAFGESPARDLALINRAVNTSGIRLPLTQDEDKDEVVEISTPKRRRQTFCHDIFSKEKHFDTELSIDCNLFFWRRTFEFTMATPVLVNRCLYLEITAYQSGMSYQLMQYLKYHWPCIMQTLPNIVYHVFQSDPKCALHHLIAIFKADKHQYLLKELIISKPQWLTSLAFDIAARYGQLMVIQLLNAAYVECCSHAMDIAATNGHLKVVKYLHQFRTEGCTVAAMDNAARNGHLHVVKFLHACRGEGCTSAALDQAAANGHLSIVAFLVRHRWEGRVNDAIATATAHGQKNIVAYLLKL